MITILEFLRARLDEDEQDAQAAAKVRFDQAKDAPSERAEVLAVQPPGSKVEAHVARWNPTRVLAEVEAKRQIVELCHSYIEAGMIQPGTTPDDDAAGAELGEVVLRALALPYADHPDYNPAWAVRAATT